MIGRGIVEYAGLEPNGTGIVIASNKMYYISFDSEKPIDYSEDSSQIEDETSKFVAL